MGNIMVSSTLSSIASNIKKKKKLAVAFILYKVSLEIAYAFLLHAWDPNLYPLVFNTLKYINGLIWSALLFFQISHDQSKVTTYFLNITYMLQVIPMTVVYALGDFNAMYYNVLCVCIFWMQFLAVVKFKRKFHPSKQMSKVLVGIYLLITLGTFAVIILRNGVPSLQALQIFDEYVYELRASKSFRITNYGWYFLRWTMSVFIPFFLSVAIVKKKWIAVFLMSAMVLVIYLYSGHKIYLFIIPYVLVSVVFSKRGGLQDNLMLYACYVMVGFTALALLVQIRDTWTQPEILINQVYSLLGRRMLLLPARLKYGFYDFLQDNPYVGFAGMIPFVNIESPYGEIGLPNALGYWLLGRYSGANSGFFAEAYYRFGYLGMLIGFTLLGLVINAMGDSQKRIGYPVAVGLYGYFAYYIVNGEFIGSLFIGVSFFLIMTILFVRCDDIAGKEISSIK